jgi:hypothetical protein
MRRAPAAGLWLFSRLEPDVRRLAAFAVPNVYTCMTNAGNYIPGQQTDYAKCRVAYDFMFDLGALVEAGAAAGLRIVRERQIPASPHMWGWEEGTLWTMYHRGVAETATLAAIMQWWQSVGSPEELRLHQPNNLVNVDERSPNNADYVALAAGVKWNPRFDALVKQSRLPGAAEPLRAGASAHVAAAAAVSILSCGLGTCNVPPGPDRNVQRGAHSDGMGLVHSCVFAARRRT